MKVPLLDRKAQYAAIRDEVRAAVDAVMDSQYFILGPEVEALEKEVAAYTGAKHAIGCASGTDAILLALMALGVGPGDEVVTTPFTFFATAGCVSRVGAKPLFVDIEPDTFNINPALISKAITKKTVWLDGMGCATASMSVLRRPNLVGLPSAERAAAQAALAEQEE